MCNDQFKALLTNASAQPLIHFSFTWIIETIELCGKMIKTTDLELCSEKSAPSKSYVSIDADLTWIHPHSIIPPDYFKFRSSPQARFYL